MFAPSRILETAAGTIHVYEDARIASVAAADRIAALVSEQGGRAVLGLPTGGTPISVYERLVERHRNGSLSFRDVTTFNLDEYYPISPYELRSYRSYMNHYLYAHVDLAPNRTHVFDGTVPESAVADHCAAYDRWIVEAGGLDLQLLGIGRDGHIGFNEPTSLSVAESMALPSRLAKLHPMTIEDAARDFQGNPDLVPRQAMTVGVAPILAARSILMLAFGPKKADIVSRAVRGPVTSEVPASLLQTVRDRTLWLIDEEAATRLG